MKLPEYDPSRGQQTLYDHKEDHNKGNFKFPALFFGLPAVFAACCLLLVYSILN
jgi:hypothetical protein